MPLRALYWDGDHLKLLDQRALPQREVWLSLSTWEAVAEAIRNMSVRGAPAIGVAAAYGVALAARSGESDLAFAGLAASRPTAVNLFWALNRMRSLGSFDADRLLVEAQLIESEDLEMNQAIGAHGAGLISDNAKILTICNTGSLATSGHGTALGVIRTAFQQGKVELVTACETRPRQQGLRLTAYELMSDGIPFRMIADSAAAFLMQRSEVDLVIAGADRIAANGDTANKIGTCMLAILASFHDIPFYIAAPSSTIDAAIKTGNEIPIEERDSSEITHCEGIEIAPPNCPVWNPAFDITPGNLITAIITERGVFRPPYDLT